MTDDRSKRGQGGDQPDDRRAPQLRTGNLYLWIEVEGGRWRIDRTSVRLEPALWNMLYDIAEREQIDLQRLVRRVQLSLDPELARAVARTVSANGGDETASVELLRRSGDRTPAPNVTSGLRTFVAGYFWRASARVTDGRAEDRSLSAADDVAPGGSGDGEPELDLVDEALDLVSPGYLLNAGPHLAARRAKHARRGRPRRRDG